MPAVSSVCVRPSCSVSSPGFVGVDVSKAKLDVHAPDRDFSVANDATGIRQLIKCLDRAPLRLIVLEATGGYESLAIHRLVDAGLPVAGSIHCGCGGLPSHAGFWPRPIGSMPGCWLILAGRMPTRFAACGL